VVQIAPFVLQSTTTTGTGSLSLSAETGFREAADAFGAGSGNTFGYYVRNTEVDNEWEYGEGYVNSSGELVRSKIKGSSNGDSAVSFSAGTKIVTADTDLSELETALAHPGSAGTSAHPAATQSAAGFLSPGDKTKLDGVEAGATNYTDSDAAAAAPVQTVNGQTGDVTVSTATILAPSLVSPSDGATDIGETPTLDAGGFYHDYGKSHGQSQFQVASDSGFTSIVYDSGWINATETHTVPAGNLSTSTTYYWRARYEDADGQQSDWSSAFSFTTASSFVVVYGLAQVSTGGGAGSWQWVDADGNNISLTTSDFDNHPTWGGIADETIDGQAMVRIPAFHYKVGTAPAGSDQAGNKVWWVGDGAFSGSQIHPAFMDGGSEIAQFYVGKYQAVDDPSATGTKAASLPGYNPLVNIDFPTMQTRCANRNSASGVDGFMLWSMYQRGAIQMLAIIELGGVDVQSLVASGRVNQSSAANVDAADVAAAAYRGIVGLWGNVRQWVDGLEIDGSHVVSIWDRDGNQTWVNTGVTTTANDGWQVSQHDEAGSGYDLADIFLPETVDGTESNGTYADYTYGSDVGETNKVNQGGDWGYGSRAGLFSLRCYFEASLSASRIGGRLAKV
jgi:hypothetical protein